MTPEFKIRSKRTLRGRRWWVALVDVNSETLSHTEMFNSEAAALNNVEAQKEAVTRAGIHIFDGPQVSTP